MSRTSDEGVNDPVDVLFKGTSLSALQRLLRETFDQTGLKENLFTADIGISWHTDFISSAKSIFHVKVN